MTHLIDWHKYHVTSSMTKARDSQTFKNWHEISISRSFSDEKKMEMWNFALISYGYICLINQAYERLSYCTLSSNSWLIGFLIVYIDQISLFRTLYVGNLTGSYLFLGESRRLCYNCIEKIIFSPTKIWENIFLISCSSLFVNFFTCIRKDSSWN